MQQHHGKKISIVMPVHNEQENIGPMADRLMKTFLPLQHQYLFEMLFVDDGSEDNTVKEIEKLVNAGLPVGFIKLSRNFGHQAALEAGLANSTGDAVITMDGDMQHPPEAIPAMLGAYEAGADVVQMQRTNMTDNFKGVLGLTFYKIFNTVSNSKLVPNAADFRLMSRSVVTAFLNIPGHGKLLRAIIPTIGFVQVRMDYKEETRKYGKPSYSYFDLFELALHAVFKFSRFPAYFTSLSGLALFITGMVFMVLLELGWIAEGKHHFIIAVTLLLAGCIFIAAGILCFYLYFLLEQVRQVPRYIVSKVVLPSVEAK